MKLKKSDKVQILTGDDRGRTGTIKKVFAKKGKVLIDGVNTYQKHIKPHGDQKGGIVTLSRPLHVSKVQLVCPHCDKPTRIGHSGTGKDKLRTCKKCQKPIDKNINKK